MGRKWRLKNEVYDAQPLRSKKKIEDMKWSLNHWCGRRDYILFLIGINTGLRISDLVKLNTKDVKRKKSIIVREGKSKKPRTLNLDNIYEEIQAYDAEIDTEWLFQVGRVEAILQQPRFTDSL